MKVYERLRVTESDSYFHVMQSYRMARSMLRLSISKGWFLLLTI